MLVDHSYDDEDDELIADSAAPETVGDPTAWAAADAADHPLALPPPPTATAVEAEEAARKKRKLNMYKRQEKKRREEQSTEDRRSSWSQFSKKNKTVQRAKNSHDPNWDPTRDHGEIAAQLAIDRSYGARDHR